MLGRDIVLNDPLPTGFVATPPTSADAPGVEGQYAYAAGVTYRYFGGQWEASTGSFSPAPLVPTCQLNTWRSRLGSIVLNYPG